eukprot:15444549-Alexandrium_andersonii.AAC.1
MRWQHQRSLGDDHQLVLLKGLPRPRRLPPRASGVAMVEFSADIEEALANVSPRNPDTATP